MTDKEAFASLSEELVGGLLREAIGYQVGYQIPYYQGIVGYMVEAPMLWIRHSRFPVLFIAYDRRNPEVLEDVVTQIKIGKATEFFALLVVVPTREGTGNEAEELRDIVADSVYRHDFVVLDRQHLASIIAQNSAQRLVEIILEQGVELSSLSPYVTKGPVPENMFFGREREIKAITQSVEKGDQAIVGGRRIGKSSILLRVTYLLEQDPRYRAVYLNCEDQFDYEDFLEALADEFDFSMHGSDPLAFRKLVKQLQAENRPEQLVFLLDEIDELLGFDAQAENPLQLFKVLRSLSHQGLSRFVFSGGRTLYTHLHEPQSPFFNFCTELILGPLSERSVAEIVSKPMHQLGIELPEEETLIDQLIELTACHPNLVQWLCDRLVTASDTRCVTPEDLESLGSGDEFKEYLIEVAWGTSAPLEKIITLIATEPAFEVEEMVTKLQSYGLVERVRIERALKMLRLQAFLERQDTSYRLTLSQFPGVVHDIKDIDVEVEALLRQMET
jgi:hypothetical protein